MKLKNNLERFFFTEIPTTRYLIFGLLAAIIIVILFSLPRLILKKANYLYLRLLLEEPVDRSKPPITYIGKIKKGDQDLNPLPRVDILSVRYYPAEPLGKSDQYDFLLTVKIKLDDTRDKNVVYSFRNNAVKLGSYIELNLPRAHVFGKILDLSSTNFRDKYVTKTLTLVKVEGYSPVNRGIYDDIIIGDRYFDGEENVFQVIEKKLEDIIPTSWTYDYYRQEIGSTKNIVMKAKMRLRQENGHLLYGNNQIIKTNKLIDLGTSKNIFEWFEITKID